MKTICWNGELIIKAENEQDANWLFKYVTDLCDSKEFDNFIELSIGEFDWESKLVEFGEMYMVEFRKELKRKTFGSDSVYIETNNTNKTGESGVVVSMTINPRGF